MTALNPDDLRHEFQSIAGYLDALHDQLVNWLCQRVEELGLLEARVEGRVKETYSFVNKALRKELEGKGWDDPLAQATDKVGARADVLLLEHVDILRESILTATDTFESIALDDKSDALGVDRLGYHGVHFDVVPKDIPAGLKPEYAICEIQVRTHAQAAWAMAVHDLTYKAPIEVPLDVERSINRLTALIELFDEGVRDARIRMMSTGGYPVAILIASLETQRMRFTGRRYDRELTQRLLFGLVDLSDDPGEATTLAGDIAGFVDAHAEKIQKIFEAQFGAGEATLLVQPEALLIFYLLESDPFKLQARWIDLELPYRFLEQLAILWGVPLPVPH